MNAEFQRNLWLELTPRRAAIMLLVPTLIFLAIGSVGGAAAVARAAEYLFYLIVVVWGSREAAQAVVGEIRDRTWDSQRLSSLTPFAMTWGKLFGATAYQWLGGLFCLVVLIAITLDMRGPAATIFDLFYFLTIGVMAHAAALFASLLSVRRRQPHSRFEVFLYQLAGWLAALAARGAWQATLAPGRVSGALDVTWWATIIDGRVFYLTSMCMFLLWACVGCYRLMRIELQMRNGPYVWLGFIVFMAIYVAGFENGDIATSLKSNAMGESLALAAATLGALVYLAVLAEPKDRVLYRWMLETAAKHRYAALIPRLQGWMIGYALCFLVTLVLAVQLGNALSLTVLAMLGFLTRDIALLLLFPLLPGPRRSDLAALVILAVLYTVLPELLNGIGMGMLAKLLFTPFALDAGILAPLIAWGEAAGMWLLLFLLGRSEKPAAVAATAS